MVAHFPRTGGSDNRSSTGSARCGRRAPVRVLDGGDLMGVEVVDHIVLGDSAYFSYREAGRLERLSPER